MYNYDLFLQRELFGPTPANTPFLGATHRRALLGLDQGIHELPGVSILVAESGTGKTTLVRSLLGRQIKGIRIAYINDPTVSFEQMLGLIVKELGIHPVGYSPRARLAALGTFAADLGQDDRVVLIFDGAERLSDEALQQVRQLAETRKPGLGLQIILVGQPSLVHRLLEPNNRALDHIIKSRTILCRLRTAEAYDYVQHLLSPEGASRRPFSFGALDWIVSYSAGIPRVINRLCHDSIVRAYSEGASTVRARDVIAVARQYDDLPAPAPQDDIRVSKFRFEMLRCTLYWLCGRGKSMAIGCATVVILAGLVFACS
jgi:type II secretory pathway predicted ATPase ExeA